MSDYRLIVMTGDKAQNPRVRFRLSVDPHFTTIEVKTHNVDDFISRVLDLANEYNEGESNGTQG